MTTPETITVLGLPYRVTVGKVEEARALVDFERLEISLSDSLHPHLRREALLHEVIHACEDAGEFSLKEHQVARLSKTLFAVLRENPGFARWLLEGVDYGR